jgi:hypothetical protein
MELPVQIRKIFILALTLFSASIITAQHQIDKDVTFSYKGKTGYARLNSFLAFCKFDQKDSENCLTTSGIVKFQITPKGKIASIDTEGNLPADLIQAVKERIKLTENSWIFSDAIIKKNKNIEFYYPIYIELSKKCNYKIHESNNLLNKLFEKQSVIQVKDDIYIIEPLVWFAEIS